MFFNILKSKKAEGSVSTAIKVVISVVLGGLVLLGTIGLIDTTIGPALNDTLNTQQGEEISNPINLSNPSVSEIKPGDVNFDGFINENDVEYLTRYLNGWEGYGWENSHLVTDYMSKVDLDSNDIIDTEDLELLKEMIIANSIHHSGFIPKGAKYTVRSTGKVLEEGDLFPKTIEDLDIYEYGDYVYVYNGCTGIVHDSYSEAVSLKSINGWNVNLAKGSYDKSYYGKILETINGQNITGMIATFELGGTKIIESPEIPKTVIYMNDTFCICKQLSKIPEIPEGVINMNNTFAQCQRTFEQDVTLPKTVVNIESAFHNCGILGTLKVPCTADYSGDKDDIFGPYADSQTVEVYHYEGCGH